jgi:hypothetical protein
MKVEDLKTSLGLMNTLIKLREISVIFNEQVEVIIDKNSVDYKCELGEFNNGIFRCISTIGKMIGDNVTNELYDLMPHVRDCDYKG